MQLATTIQTMSSREIAELTGKSHNHVMRDIRAMMTELEGNPDLDSVCKSTTYNGSNGQSYNQYELDKDTCLTLLLGYDAVARIKVVKRWQELEEKERSNSLVLPNFTDPAEAAIAWATEYKAKQLAMQQLEVAKPKVEYVDKYVDRGNLKSITDVAKEMGISSKALGVWLRENGHAWANKVPVRWSQPFIDKGYGEMKQYTTAGGFDGTQAMFTAAGDVFVKQAYNELY